MDNLFGKRCAIPTGMSERPFIYRILSSDTESNAWSEPPITASSERNLVRHDYYEQILFVVMDGIIDETSRILRVARKDVKIID